MPNPDKNNVVLTEERYNELIDTLHMALPYVEDAEHDPCFKVSVVRRDVKRIHKVLGLT